MKQLSKLFRRYCAVKAHLMLFEIKCFEWNHVLTFYGEQMAKMHFSHTQKKNDYSNTNEAIDVVFTGNLNESLFYTNVGK